MRVFSGGVCWHGRSRTLIGKRGQKTQVFTNQTIKPPGLSRLLNHDSEHQLTSSRRHLGTCSRSTGGQPSESKTMNSGSTGTTGARMASNPSKGRQSASSTRAPDQKAVLELCQSPRGRCSTLLGSGKCLATSNVLLKQGSGVRDL